MAEVSLNKVFTSFQRADKDGDGVLTKKEIATEALKLNSEGKTDEFRLFSTFLVGGTDQAGLYPDFFGSNGKTGTDGKISMADLAKLAAADINTTNGTAESISADDFTTMFGSRANSTTSIDIDDIKEIAGSSSSSDDDDDSDSDSSDLLKKLLPILLLTGATGGGSNGGGINPLMLLLFLKGSDSSSSSSDSLTDLLPILLLSGSQGSSGAYGSSQQQNPFALLSLLSGGDDSDLGDLLGNLF